MLYALVIAAIFSLLLEFYLTLQVENNKNLIAQRRFLSAQIMSQIAIKKGKKSMSFDKGEVEIKEKMAIVKFSDGTELTLDK